MNTLRYAVATMRATLALLWASTAAAGTVILASDQSPQLVIDTLLLVLTAVVATLAGVTTLAIRVNAKLLEADDDGRPKPFVRPWLFAISHMLGSWLAGCAMFILSRMNHWDVWTTLFSVLMLSFLGSKGVEMLAEKWMGGVKVTPTAP